MSILIAASGVLGGYVSPAAWNIVGGPTTLTVITQPAVPSAPAITGTNLTLTVTG